MEEFDRLRRISDFALAKVSACVDSSPWWMELFADASCGALAK